MGHVEWYRIAERGGGKGGTDVDTMKRFSKRSGGNPGE